MKMNKTFYIFINLHTSTFIAKDIIVISRCRLIVAYAILISHVSKLL